MASYNIALRVAVMVPKELLDRSWLPGRSVGHTDGLAGSLGLFVEVTREIKQEAEHDPDAPMTAFVSAAHVLAPPIVKKLEVGDFIFSPCPPFAKPVGTNRRAKLVNFITLKISPSAAPVKAPTNEGDLAVAALQKPAQVHNRVPKPQLQDGCWKAGDFIQLATLVDRDQLTQIVEKKAVVFKIGRSTGFSWGVLQSKNLPSILLASGWVSDLL